MATDPTAILDRLDAERRAATADWTGQQQEGARMLETLGLWLDKRETRERTGLVVDMARHPELHLKVRKGSKWIADVSRRGTVLRIHWHFLPRGADECHSVEHAFEKLAAYARGEIVGRLT